MTSSRNLLPRLKLLSAFLLLFLVNGKIALAQPAATVTTLAVTAAGSPVTSIPAFTAVTLTATVTSNGTPTTRGQVYFCNAIEPACNYTNNLAIAQLTSAGTATFKLIPGPGSHSYVAVFPTADSMTTSKSAASPSFTVTGATPHTNSVVSASGNAGSTILNSTVYATGSTAPTGDVSFTVTPYEQQTSTTIPVAPAPLIANAPAYNLSPIYPSPLNINWTGLLYADFNGDGIPDVLTSNEYSIVPSSCSAYTATVYYGVGDGTFSGSGNTFSTICKPANGVVADVNNDGFPDIILSVVTAAHTDTYSLNVFLNDGRGNFTAAPASITLSGQVQQLATADFNLDGNVDIAYVINNDLVIAMGDGTGNFTPGNPLAGAFSYMTVADMNNDGMPDVVTTDPNTQVVTVYLGIGNGTFSGTPTTYSNNSLAINYFQPTAGDFNNDGNLDIALVNDSSNCLNCTPIPYAVNILWGNGAGGFTSLASLPYPTGTPNPGDLLAADINADGKMDIISANSASYLFIGNGTGTFQVAGIGDDYTAIPPTNLVALDMNGDGLLDIPGFLASSISSTATATPAIPPSSGIYTLQSSYPGDTNYHASLAADSVPFDAATTNPTITLTGPSSPAALNTPLTFTASVTGVAGPASGTVGFFEGSTLLGSSTLNSNGTLSYAFEFSTVGTYAITAQYSGSAPGVYNEVTSAPYSFTVSTELPPTVTVTASPTSAVYGTPVTVTIKVSGSSGVPTGTVDLYKGSLDYETLTLDGTGSASATFSGDASLPAGTTAISAHYAGNTQYNSAVSSSTNVTVSKEAPTVTLSTATPTPAYGAQLVLTASIPYTGNFPTGTLAFYVDGKLNNTSYFSSNNAGVESGNLITSSLLPGSHSVTVTYSGDSNYTTATSSPFTVTVGKAATTSQAYAYTPQQNTYGSPITLSSRVSGITGLTPTGTITFSYGSVTLGTGTLDATGLATLTPSPALLPAGSDTITFTYSGDANYLPRTPAAATIAFAKANVGIALASSVTTATPGSPVTLTATITFPAGVPTGHVTLYDGSTVIATLTPTNGVAAFTDSSLSNGTHSITAAFAGDSNYNSATSSAVSVTVGKKAASILTSELSKPYTYGSPASLVITVAGGSGGVFPTGTVTFSNGVTTLGTTNVMSNTQAALTVAAGKLPGGTSTITISYSGDSNFTSATATATVTVSQVQPTLALTSSASTAFGGTPITFTAKLTYTGSGTTPTGQITLYDGATAITSLTPTNGVITFSDSTLSAGANSITAGYAGDTNYAAATSSAVSVTINKGTVTLDTAEMTHSTFTYNTNFGTTPFTVSVYGSTHDVFPTGTLTFSTGGGLQLGQVPVMNNAPATVTISDLVLAQGYNTINVSYSGDNNYPSATTTVVVLLQTQPNLTWTLSGSGYLYIYGTPITMTAKVASTDANPLTGLITFYDGTTALSSTAIPSGNSTTTYTATYTNSTLAVGNHNLSFTYTNDPKNLSANSGGTPIVIKKTTDSIVTSEFSNSFTYGSPTPLVVTIAGGSGGVFPTGTVTFSYAGEGTSSTTVPVMSNTQAAATLAAGTLFAGTTPVTVSYSGDVNFPPVTVTANVTLAKEPTSVTLTSSTTTATVGSPITFTAITSPTNSGLYGAVSLYDGATAIASFGGMPGLTYSNLAVGTHTITAVYTADTTPRSYANYLNSTSSPITITITAPPASSTSKK